MSQVFVEKQDQQSLNDDGTIVFELPSDGDVQQIAALVDDGAGATPAGYQLDAEVWDSAAGRYKPYQTFGSDGSPDTSFSHVVDAVGQKMQLTLTNRSAGTATFDLTVKAQR